MRHNLRNYAVIIKDNLYLSDVGRKVRVHRDLRIVRDGPGVVKGEEVMERQKAKGKRQNCKSKFKTLLLLIFTLNLCHAETLSSTELIENAKSLDGQTVDYKGEVITAILNRGEHSWI